MWQLPDAEPQDDQNSPPPIVSALPSQDDQNPAGTNLSRLEQFRKWHMMTRPNQPFKRIAGIVSMLRRQHLLTLLALAALSHLAHAQTLPPKIGGLPGAASPGFLVVPPGYNDRPQWIIPRYANGKTPPAGGLVGYGPASVVRATADTVKLPVKAVVITQDYDKRRADVPERQAAGESATARAAAVHPRPDDCRLRCPARRLAGRRRCERLRRAGRR